MDLEKLLERSRMEEEKLAWEGTFAQYLQMVTQNPELAHLSHERIYHMVIAAGTEPGRWGEKKYKLFSPEVFGLEKALQRLVDYYASAARRMEIRKRILLLVGPPASGKSTIVNVIKRGLEDYTKTDEGALYAIKGCPMQEEPLHLIPSQLRPELEREYGIYIEGDLCPRCRYMVRHTYQGKIEEVKVRRITLSEREGVGVGTFVATAPGSQDLSRLVGSIDEAALGEDRLEAGHAYRLDGELNVANRGLMEFIEMLKSDEKFLTVLLTLSQEQQIKTGRFGTVYVDEAVISHTNEAEYNSFVANQKSEALQDRIIIANIPYNLKVSDEVKIYEKMLRDSDLAGIHFAPDTLRVASTFAVLSRLKPSGKYPVSPMKKLKLYNGHFIEEYTAEDVEEMREEAVREGMEGISPRYVMNQLSKAASGVTCIDPIRALQALWDGLGEHISMAKEEKQRLTYLFQETRKEYDEIAKREVQKSFVESFQEKVEKAFNDYLEQVKAFCTKEGERDESLLRSVEEPIGVREHLRKDFREDIWAKFSTLAQEGVPFDYTTDERLRTGLERKLLPDLKKVSKVVVLGRSPSQEQLKQRDELAGRLVQEHGYCPACARETISHVARLMGGGEERPGLSREIKRLWGPIGT